MNRISVNRISVTKDFTKLPGGRYKDDGPYSGEAFREEFLIPALRQGKVFEIDFDHLLGAGSSFLEDAFGGLVRAGFSAETIRSQIVIVSTEWYGLADRIWSYVDDASAR